MWLDIIYSNFRVFTNPPIFKENIFLKLKVILKKINNNEIQTQTQKEYYNTIILYCMYNLTFFKIIIFNNIKFFWDWVWIKLLTTNST